MLGFLVLLMVAGLLATVLVFLLTLVKLLLLPVRLAFGVAKLAFLGVAAVLLVLVGLPFLAVFLLPLVVLGFAAWGAMRLVRA